MTVMMASVANTNLNPNSNHPHGTGESTTYAAVNNQESENELAQAGDGRDGKKDMKTRKEAAKAKVQKGKVELRRQASEFRANPASKFLSVIRTMSFHSHGHVHISEIIIYFTFLASFTVVSLGYGSIGDDDTAYHMTKSIRERFVHDTFEDPLSGVHKNFANDIGGTTDYWNWFRYIVVPNVEMPYNNDQSGRMDNGPFAFSMMQNMFIGSMRLWQQRVKNSCEIPSAFHVRDEHKAHLRCGPRFGKASENRDPFGTPENPDAYTWYADGTFVEVEDDGGDTADSGFLVDLPMNQADMLATMNRLMADQWIDHLTRLVSLDFNLYNFNTKLFSVVRLRTEFLDNGNVHTTYSFHTAKFLRYDTDDSAVIAMDAFCLVMICWFIYEELSELTGRYHDNSDGSLTWQDYLHDYFGSFWNYLDLSNITLFIVSTGLRIYIHFDATRILDAHKFPIEQYVNLRDTSRLKQQEIVCTALNSFLLWTKVFKYFRFTSHLLQLAGTLYLASREVLYFIIMFMVMLFGFSMMGFLLFGTEVYDYRNPGAVILTMGKAVLGDMDVDALWLANRMWGPIYFTLVICVVILFLLNMFLAIVNDAYTRFRTDKEVQRKIKSSIYLPNRIRSKWNAFRKKMSKPNSKGKTLDPIQEANIEIMKNLAYIQFLERDVRRLETLCVTAGLIHPFADRHTVQFDPVLHSRFLQSNSGETVHPTTPSGLPTHREDIPSSPSPTQDRRPSSQLPLHEKGSPIHEPASPYERRGGPSRRSSALRENLSREAGYFADLFVEIQTDVSRTHNVRDVAVADLFETAISHNIRRDQWADFIRQSLVQ